MAATSHLPVSPFQIGNGPAPPPSPSRASARARGLLPVAPHNAPEMPPASACILLGSTEYPPGTHMEFLPCGSQSQEYDGAQLAEMLGMDISSQRLLAGAPGFMGNWEGTGSHGPDTWKAAERVAARVCPLPTPNPTLKYEPAPNTTPIKYEPMKVAALRSASQTSDSTGLPQPEAANGALRSPDGAPALCAHDGGVHLAAEAQAVAVPKGALRRRKRKADAQESSDISSPFADPTLATPFDVGSAAGTRPRKELPEQRSSTTVITLTCPEVPPPLLDLQGQASVEPDPHLEVTLADVEAKLPVIPTHCKVDYKTSLSLLPVLLRGNGGLIAANVGLHVQLIEHDPNVLHALYRSDPRNANVVTTGIPPRPSEEWCERARQAKAQVVHARMSLRTRSTGAPPVHVAAPVEQHCQRDDYIVQEAMLLKRSTATGAVDDKWHVARAQLDGAKMLDLPTWDGDGWLVDVVARAANAKGSYLWVKALGVRLHDITSSGPGLLPASKHAWPKWQ